MSKKDLWTPQERLNYTDSFIKIDREPINLDFWQEAFLADTRKFLITLKSRRTGFSFIVALKGLVKALDSARFKYVRQFVSYNEEDAKEKINYVKEFYATIPKKYKKKIASETKTSIEFYDVGGKTTSRLISIACRPPRGRGGDIVLDEMGIYPINKAAPIYTASLPVIARGGCIEIGSTPLGKVGTFYDVFTNKDTYGEYSRYLIPWWLSTALCTDLEKAIDEAENLETEERVKRFGTETMQMIFRSMLLEDFQQEFECTFVDSATSFITLDLIYANTPGMREEDRTSVLVGANPDEKDIEDEEEIEIQVFKDADSLIFGYNAEKHGRLFFGYDVARYRDAAVIFVIGVLDNGKKQSIAEIEMRDKTFEQQRDILRKILKLLPVVRGCIDRTGQGENTTEQLQKEFGSAKIEGVLFNPAIKEELVIAVRSGLEQKEFLLQNDRKFHRQIHSIKRTPTAGGGFRYDSARDKDGHADSFWAWALANHAITGVQNVKQGFYQQLKEKKKRRKQKETKPKGKTYNQLMRDWGI